MKLLYLSILLLCSGCDKSPISSEDLEDTATETETLRFSDGDSIDVLNKEVKGEKEDFDSFFPKFSSDSTFQLSRVEFPYKIILVEDEGTVTRYLGKKDWSYVDFSQMQVGKHHLEKKEESNNTVTVLYTLEDTGVYISYKFNKKQGKWMLTSMEDSST
ncbi:DUF4348 domain-containing protein [Pontibacter indicus]|uniref:DUF4348 domain-containing protein n=1 Tax=Pontibacter indicus TaxID=1317125 RepID=A0A1R3XTR7_9BACT|nr:DUF4348 domain-containing protein [Pontibacter indicus]SIT94813.1 protein of unknown function [Pontibacter indicus]